VLLCTSSAPARGFPVAWPGGGNGHTGQPGLAPGLSSTGKAGHLGWNWPIMIASDRGGKGRDSGHSAYWWLPCWPPSALHSPSGPGRSPLAWDGRGWQWLGQHCQPSNGGCDLLLLPVQGVPGNLAWVWQLGAHAHVATTGGPIFHVGDRSVGACRWQGVTSALLGEYREFQGRLPVRYGASWKEYRITITKSRPPGTCDSFIHTRSLQYSLQCRRPRSAKMKILRKTLRSSLHQGISMEYPTFHI
jgi:hypothetical protein